MIVKTSAGDNYSIRSVTNDMPEEETTPKIDWKALEAVTKKVLAHKPKKQAPAEGKHDNQ